MKWQRFLVRDVVFFQEGPGLRTYQWSTEGMKVINVTNILGDGSIDTKNTNKYIALDEFNRKYAHFAVENKDIVVASSGNTFGKVGRITQKDLPLMMNTSVIRFRSSDTSTLDNDFLYAWIRSGEFQNQVKSFVTGGAQPNFGPTHVRQMTIFVPSLDTQQQIGIAIRHFDDLIENNRRRIAILEALARNLYQEWFVRLRFPGHETTKIVDGVPEGWSRGPVGSVIDFNPKVRIQKNHDIVFVPMGALSTSGMSVDLSLLESVQEPSGAKFCRGDTLLARITPCLENGKTAYVNFLGEEPGCGSTEFIVLRGASVGPRFTYCLARSDLFRDKAVHCMTGSSGRQRVQSSSLEEYEVLSPTMAISDEFEASVAPGFDLIERLMLMNQRLTYARDLLLPRLMSGELEP